MNLLFSSFIGTVLFFIMYIFDFNVQQLSEYMNNKLLSHVNIKLMAHNYLISLFDKSISTNALLYLIIFSFEIILFTFLGSITSNYVNKIPFYILALLIFDFINLQLNFWSINFLKGNLSFLIVETYFGHIFSIYEIGGIFFNIIISFILNKGLNKRDKAK